MQKKDLNSNDIVSVSQYLDQVNNTLKKEKSRILGEVSGLQEYPGRSYLYFSIKDKTDQSTVKCFMWKNDYRISGVKLTDGMEIIVTAYPAIYKPNGGFTLQVELVELLGEGALKIAYDKLKQKLEAEGFFATSRKRPIPNFCKRIGVITSKSGAVINDFLTNIGRHGFEILFVDSKVEGQDAIKDLLSALSSLKLQKVDVLVMMRGGGSLESFQAFNNEELVRAVASFPAPVVTGIGHDKDVPLVSLVSDLNVSTPTAVAHAISKSFLEATSGLKLYESKILNGFETGRREVLFQLSNAQVEIEQSFANIFESFNMARNKLIVALGRIDDAILNKQDFLKRSSGNLFREFEIFQKNVSENLKNIEKLIEQGSPLRQLSRGYSIVRSFNKIIRSKKDVSIGDRVSITVEDGIINSQII